MSNEQVGRVTPPLVEDFEANAKVGRPLPRAEYSQYPVVYIPVFCVRAVESALSLCAPCLAGYLWRTVARYRW